MLYERIDNRLSNVEILANETRAEFRAVRDELKKKISEVEKQSHAERVRELTDNKADRREVRIEMWKLVTAALLQAMFIAAVLMLNWDRVEDFGGSLWRHLHHPIEVSASAPAKKGRAHRRKPKPIVMPEVQSDAAGGDVP